MLHNCFDQESIEAIRNIPRWNPRHCDNWIWLKSSIGQFTVKSAFNELHSSDDPGPSSLILSNIWKTPLHDRLKMLL